MIKGRSPAQTKALYKPNDERNRVMAHLALKTLQILPTEFKRKSVITK